MTLRQKFLNTTRICFPGKHLPLGFYVKPELVLPIDLIKDKINHLKDKIDSSKYKMDEALLLNFPVNPENEIRIFDFLQVIVFFLKKFIQNLLAFRIIGICKVMGNVF